MCVFQIDGKKKVFCLGDKFKSEEKLCVTSARMLS